MSDLGTASQNLHVVTVENGNTGTVYFDDVSLEQSVATTYAWTYDNRLASTTQGSNVTTYQYDHAGQRVTLKDSTGTTTYANSLYSTKGGTSTKHIYANGELIASVEGSGAGAMVHYAHTDHLGGMNVATKADGTLEQVLDYYPFGSQRNAYTATQFDEDKKFTGHEYDSTTGLYYMQARYQEPELGRFVSQDSAFHMAGDYAAIEAITGMPYRLYLADPQVQNSYSYVRNSPLMYTDPNGEFLRVLFIVAAAVVIDIGFNPIHDGDVTEEQQASSESLQKKLDISSLIIGLVTNPGGSATRSGGKLLNEVTQIARNYANGMSFEERVRSLYDIGQKITLTINGNRRTPDGVDIFNRTVSEIKNVAHLSYTAQLQDYVDFAQATGFKFYLYVAAHTQLSGPLQNAVDEGLIILQRISPD